jgi:glutaredoxin
MKDNEIYSCKTCKYCKHDFRNTTIFAWGSDYAYVCTKDTVEDKEEINFVTGKVTVEKRDYERCSSMRLSMGECGHEGKFWEPKYEKDLFKYIKRS